ncbi:LysR family transcriptional regulator [Acidisoma cellulosilytica]|uniref:LysR family transcriptional regulator n=1 Tax=Acidisoma cellulosilyticum TaxID=2802395 RepID=A0A963Z293_9PROT|nr:LysR family transcriptional regulator [Acidisoma cellulosilyticum]MCB8880523.1 LysR family transcriptional regulator [Acidisoma cellulosilyticum]
MPLLDRSTLADLNAFSAIVRHRSLRGAAIELGVTASALSHTIRRLETRLNAKLLNRTTRSVAPTVLGIDLARDLETGFALIDDALRTAAGTQAEALGEIRLNVPADAALLLLQPALPAFTAKTPGTRLTVSVDNRPVDIVAEGFDAGIRYGDAVAQDMIAIPLTGALRWVLAASPDYLARRGRPESTEDLQRHQCIRLMLGNNAVYRWELGDGAAMIRLDVPGMLTINDTQTSLAAIRGGLGIGYVLEALIEDDLRQGALEIVLPAWSSLGAGFCLYYPSRRQSHPALARLISIIRRQWNERTLSKDQAA